MTIILAAVLLGILIGSSIIVHGYLNDRALYQMQSRQQDSQQLIQRRQQQHEMEFAESQAKMFRENLKKQDGKAS